jgi:hypothetical protein
VIIELNYATLHARGGIVMRFSILVIVGLLAGCDGIDRWAELSKGNHIIPQDEKEFPRGPFDGIYIGTFIKTSSGYPECPDSGDYAFEVRGRYLLGVGVWPGSNEYVSGYVDEYGRMEGAGSDSSFEGIVTKDGKNSHKTTVLIYCDFKSEGSKRFN